MYTEDVTYPCGDKQLKGYLCHNRTLTEKRPGIIVAHAWRGLDEFARLEARRLASMGYVAFAADVYGVSQPAQTDTEAGQLMAPLFLDRELLQQRIGAAYEQLAAHPLVDSKRIGAIGFCFGGLTVVELLRSGRPVRGVVSFHGGLSNKMGDKAAKTVPIAANIKGSALILHGYEDPLMSQEDISNIQKELTQAKVDWQMVIYGHTSHAFTNPEVANGTGALRYNEQADRRSWIAMCDFFDEVFKF